MMKENEIRIAAAVLLGLFFLSVFYGIYQTLYLMKQQEILKQAWEKSVRVLDEKNQTRKKLEKQSASLYGAMENRSLAARLDGMLAYSGLQTRHPFITAERCMAVLLTTDCMAGIAIWLLSGTLLLSLGVVVLVPAAFFPVMHTLCYIRQKRIDEETLHCLDVMEMQALSGVDVIEIIRKTALKVREPLRAELLNTAIDAGNSGNTSQAMRRLCNRIENKYLKDIILNLDICSRFKANYREVITTGKKIYMKDAANRNKLKKLHRNTLMFFLVLVCVGIICLKLIGSMVAGNGSVIRLLWSYGTVGQLVLIYLGAVIVCSIWSSLMKAL